MRHLALTFLLALTLFACSRAAPATGKWEGTYGTDDTMIAARLEIAPDGMVKVSAPDLLGVSGSQDDREAMRERLAGDLIAGWGEVVPRKMDFDGETFRKPGGIAPQMIWKAKKKQMLLVVYIGTQPSIRIPMREVGDFSENPFTQ